MLPKPSPVWRVRIFILLLAVAAGLLAYTTQFRRGEAVDVALQAQPQQQPSRAEIATKEFSLAQVAQHMYVSFVMGDQDEIAAQVEQFAAWNIGGIVVFGSNISAEQAQVLTSELAKHPAWQPEILVDHEGGLVQRFSGTGFTRLPAWQVLCTLSATERRELLSTSLQELQAIGVTMVLAPVVDLGSDNPVLETRLCSDDPALVVAAASDYIDVALSLGITPVLKHYPGLGSTSIDSHEGLEAIDPSEQEVGIFSQLLEQYPIPVMVGHVAINSKDPSTPCSLSKPCVMALKEAFPNTMVISDALEMRAAKQDDSLTVTTMRAIEAGNDYLLYGNPVTVEELAAVLEELTTLLQ